MSEGNLLSTDQITRDAVPATKLKFNTNAVSYTRPEYRLAYDTWEKVRDAVAGEDAIKSKHQKYLPTLSGHTGVNDPKYKTYLDYAHWYSATSRTLAGLRGLVFRKDPLKLIPDGLDEYYENITADGQSLIAFSKSVLVEVLQTNRCGIFVDLPNVDVSVDRSIAEAKRENIRPYARMYPAESIINWRTAEVNNSSVTTLVVLTENIEIPGDDGFSTVSEIRYRVLYLDEEGVYNQAVYERQRPDVISAVSQADTGGAVAAGTGGYIRVTSITPMIDGKTLNYIPFYPITDKGITWELTHSTLLPLVNTNISHYRNSANRENALIWTGNPSPVFSGYQGGVNDNKLRLGSTEAILLENGGTAQFLEFTGQGINPIKEVMLEKEEEMAVLGARIIAPEKRTAETAESAQIHRAGEQGVLADIANSVSSGLTKILQFIAQFEKIEDWQSIYIELNTDFMPSTMEPAMISTLAEMFRTKMISWDTYFYNLQQGEIIPEGVDAASEFESIKANKGIYDYITEQERKDEEQKMMLAQAKQAASLASNNNDDEKSPKDDEKDKASNKPTNNKEVKSK